MRGRKFTTMPLTTPPKNKPRALYQILNTLTRRLLAATSDVDQTQILHTMV
jgi:hypothetical protein